MHKGMVGLAMLVRTGMLSVLASLVLGLLIATAKTSHDSTDLAIRNYAAELALLNEALRDYGGPASVPRDLLREYIEAFERQGCHARVLERLGLPPGSPAHCRLWRLPWRPIRPRQPG